ncbi:MAG: glycosyltransferase family 2 protein [Oligoflexia bacterium]|nr:glycosyltransferase family 2 protein [Oligoflexia bacterium]
MKLISIVIPVFNEEDIVQELIRRLQVSTQNIHYRYEFILIDDGSNDKTLLFLLEMQRQENRLKVIKLSRNWGHQNAYNAGIDYASGDAVIFMDGDLEDPPEMINEMIKKWEEGYQVVYTVKETREESILKKIMFSFFYKLMEKFSEINIDKQAGMFSLIDKKVANHMRQCKERNKYYVGLRFFCGFKQIKISYKRHGRLKGKPKQTIRKLTTLALNAVFSFSFIPIRTLTYFGVIIMISILLTSSFIITAKIANLKFGVIQNLPGWTSMSLLVLLVLSVQIIFMGVLGEYIARVFDEVRNRPYYIVEKVYDVEKV